MELVLGKKFKLEVWEVIVQKMSLNEVAKFTVHKSVSMQIYVIHFIYYNTNTNFTYSSVLNIRSFRKLFEILAKNRTSVDIAVA